MRKLTREDWILRFEAKHGHRFNYQNFLGLGADRKDHIKCREHNIEFEYTPRKHLKEDHGGCPSCHQRKRLAVQKQKWLNSFRKAHGEKYDYDFSIFNGTNTKIRAKCSKHGWFEQFANDHVQGSGCPECGILSRRLSLSDFKKRLSKLPYRWSFSGKDYVHGTKSVTFHCSEHGEFEGKPVEVANGKGCKSCKVIVTVEDFISKAKEVHGEKWDYSSTNFEGSLKQVHINCKTHGKFRQLPHSHLSGAGCPTCYLENRWQSAGEKRIYKLFSGYTVKQNDRKVLKPKELDVYIPSLRLAVECNGEYWHSERNKKGVNYHLEKTLQCERQGIRLYQFWDSEVKYKFPIVQSMLSHYLGRSNKVYARKTRCVEVTADKAKDFLNSNHIQGFTQAKVYLGLIYEGKLVQLASFSKPRFTRQSEWELIRLSSLLNTSVIGGASKLLSYFQRQYHPESLISYADRRYSQGQVYESLGFKKVRETSPGYFYTNGEKNISRYQAQKKNLRGLLGDKFDEALSERKNMSNHKFHRVWDCGQLVYLMNF